jgi:hypothetical protein
MVTPHQEVVVPKHHKPQAQVHRRVLAAIAEASEDRRDSRLDPRPRSCHSTCDCVGVRCCVFRSVVSEVLVRFCQGLLGMQLEEFRHENVKALVQQSK